MSKNKDISYSIDVIRLANDILTITGWASSKDPKDKVYIDVYTQAGEHIKYRKTRTERWDVSMANFGELLDEPLGFTLAFHYDPQNKYFIKLFNSNSSVTVKITKNYISWTKFRNKIAAKISHIPSFNPNEPAAIKYDKWFRRIKPNTEELEKQSNYVFPKDAPKFSIVIPLYKTPDHYLRELIQSILKQTYANFEVCFADGSPAEDGLKEKVSVFSANDPRMKYTLLSENKGISDNTNAAVAMAQGDFIVLCDHDDLLAPNALFEFTKAIMDHPDCDVLYSDEDKIDSAGKKYFEPNFKPDFNIDLLTATNYICHLFGVRKSLVDKYGAFNSEFDGSQDYDFILRMTENARNVIHVPKILYHWRTHQNSTSSNPESKLYAYTAGARAIQNYYHNKWPNIAIDKIETGVSLGIYHIIFHFDEQPLISVIIPNKDHTADLDKAIRSLITLGTWKNLEFIIVENNSVEPETFGYYKKITAEFSQVHVIHYEGSFNYSKINNLGVQSAKGKYLLFMNNDVELINPDSIQEMMGYAQRSDVGIVGCRLLYEDNTIQHAGVVIGIGGPADHVFRGQFSTNGTYFNRAMMVQDYSAVTAAVMLVRREVFDSVNGFDPLLAVAFNDVDFCLKVRAKNKLVVYNPYACFHHYESKSRGIEDTYEKQLRFVKEIRLFIERWNDFVLAGDPYYNPNLTVFASDFSVRNLEIENIGDSYYRSSFFQDLMSMSPEDFVKKTYKTSEK